MILKKKSSQASKKLAFLAMLLFTQAAFGMENPEGEESLSAPVSTFSPFSELRSLTSLRLEAATPLSVEENAAPAILDWTQEHFKRREVQEVLDQFVGICQKWVVEKREVMNSMGKDPRPALDAKVLMGEPLSEADVSCKREYAGRLDDLELAKKHLDFWSRLPEILGEVLQSKAEHPDGGVASTIVDRFLTTKEISQLKGAEEFLSFPFSIKPPYGVAGHPMNVFDPSPHARLCTHLHSVVSLHRTGRGWGCGDRAELPGVGPNLASEFMLKVWFPLLDGWKQRAEAEVTC